MSSGQTTNLQEQAISAKEVADFLRENPEFFEQHSALLDELKLKHPTSGGAISIIERQVIVLREENRELEKKLSNLIQIARENDSLNKRIQKITLALMEADSANDIFVVLQEMLRKDFNADTVVIRLFRMPDEVIACGNIGVVDQEDRSLESFRKFFESRKPICGHLKKRQAEYLFGSDADAIASAALLPICDSDCFGMLAIGSRDTKRFHSAMGTLFLGYLGEIIGRVLRPHLAVITVPDSM